MKIRLRELEVEFRKSPNRRTLQLTIDRTGDLVVSAPSSCDRPTVEAFVRSKQEWIYKKLAEAEVLRPKAPPKEYVTGEGFHYLGRSYRLLLVEKQDVPVKLEGGRFKMLRSAAPTGRRHMQAWYTTRGQPWLERKVDESKSRIGVAPESVVVRDLGYRWGSCGRNGTINFHWKTVLLPPRMIVYIVVHELVHLEETLHSETFWKRVERAMPDYALRKRWLAENGSSITAV